MKIKLIYYSPYRGNSHKAPQLRLIFSELVRRNYRYDFFGVRYFSQKKSKERNIEETVIPKLVSKLIVLWSKYGRKIPSYFVYKYSQKVFGIIASNLISFDNNGVVICKERPYSIVKAAKKSNSKVVLDYGESHPRLMYDLLHKEAKSYPISLFDSFYADLDNVEEAEKSILIADKIIVLSEFSKKSFIDYGVDKDKISVINLPVNYLYRGDREKKDIAFITTAHHNSIKGTHRLIEAWSKANVGSNKLYIAGTISDDILDIINQHDLKNVIITGTVNIEEKYPDKDYVGISCSLAEGFSRSVSEYISWCFPVIVTECSTCDFVIDQRHGYVNNYDDEMRLINALEQLCNRDNYDTFQKNIYEDLMIKNDFKYEEKFVDEIENMYKG